MSDFIAVIEELILLFQHLIQIEQTKLEAVQKNRVTYVEDCMNQEQAAILKLRGLDKKREACQEKLGFGGYTFQQILSAVNGEQHENLKKLFDSLSYQVRLFQEINESAKSMLEVNLHMINKAIHNSSNGTTMDKSQWEGRL